MQFPLSYVGFCVASDIAHSASCWAHDSRNMLKTFILIVVCANRGNWHSPCKTKGGNGKDQRLSQGLHHRVCAYLPSRAETTDQGASPL